MKKSAFSYTLILAIMVISAITMVVARPVMKYSNDNKAGEMVAIYYNNTDAARTVSLQLYDKTPKSGVIPISGWQNIKIQKGGYLVVRRSNVHASP